MDTAAVLQCVVEHLNIGDIFRLRRALGRAPAWSEEDTAGCIASKMGRKRHARTNRSNLTLAATATSLSSTRTRCVECGGYTRSRLHVCIACTEDEDGYFAMITRIQARALFIETTGHVMGYKYFFERLLRLPVARRGGMGRCYYWRRVVEKMVRPSPVLGGTPAAP